MYLVINNSNGTSVEGGVENGVDGNAMPCV